jgi:hypothetical protein
MRSQRSSSGSSTHRCSPRIQETMVQLTIREPQILSGTSSGNHFRSLAAQSASDETRKPKSRNEPSNTGIKRGRDSAPHFTAAKPMFEMIGELPLKASAIPGKFFKYAGNQKADPMFKLPDSSGKFCNICLMSSCQPPFNACFKSSPCIPSKRDGRERNPFLHLDLAESPWRDAPESFSPQLLNTSRNQGSVLMSSPLSG